jgi:hypothetical protein
VIQEAKNKVLLQQHQGIADKEIARKLRPRPTQPHQSLLHNLRPQMPVEMPQIPAPITEPEWDKKPEVKPGMPSPEEAAELVDAVRNDFCDFYGNMSLAMEKIDSTFPTGKLTKMDFEGFVERTLKWTRKDCSKAFYAIDANQDGTVSMRELLGLAGEVTFFEQPLPCPIVHCGGRWGPRSALPLPGGGSRYNS